MFFSLVAVKGIDGITIAMLVMADGKWVDQAGDFGYYGKEVTYNLIDLHGKWVQFGQHDRFYGGSDKDRILEALKQHYVVQ